MFSKNEINQVVEKVREVSNPDKIYLFGSYAYGNPNENSDLDLCIVKKEVKDKSKELLEVSLGLFNIPIPVDIVLLDEKSFNKRNNVWGSLQYEVFHKGLKVYEK